MALFITTKAEATRHGVYAIEKLTPLTITPTGTGVAAIVEQFPWGPAQTLTTPDSRAQMFNMLAPPGMDRTGSGYLAIIRKGFPLLKFLRVLGNTAAAATAEIKMEDDPDPVTLFTVTLKYPGSAGNNVVITTSAASDGDPNHFNLTATVTGASGVTSETIHNVNFSGVGADTELTAEQLQQLRLIGSITKASGVSGVPIIGSTTCSGGTDGTVNAAAYVGTAGTGDAGLSKLEGDRTIRHVFTGDPGNSLRADVNAGLKAHADLLTDRVAYINGNSAQSSASARSDAANYQSQRVVYCDPWVYIKDDVTQSMRLVPSAPFAASVAAQLPPSTSIAWKADIVGTMLGGIVDLEADRGEGAALNTAAGVATFIKEETGGFRIEAGVTTIAPANPAKKNLTRTLTGIYIASSIKQSLRPMTDMPNLPIYQQNIVDAITGFMEGMKKNATREDAVFLPHVLDYAIGDLDAENPQAELDAGDFTVPLDAKTSSGMERIFLNINYGETVQVTSA